MINFESTMCIGPHKEREDDVIASVEINTVSNNPGIHGQKVAEVLLTKHGDLVANMCRNEFCYSERHKNEVQHLVQSAKSSIKEMVHDGRIKLSDEEEREL